MENSSSIMNQFLSLNQLDKISDLSEILKEAETLKTEISKTKKFLVKFGLNANLEKTFAEVNKQENSIITNRKESLLDYLKLKVALIDLLLIINDNQLTEIYKGYHQNPALFDRLIQGARITTENRREVIKNLNWYIAFKSEQGPSGFPLFSQNN